MFEELPDDADLSAARILIEGVVFIRCADVVHAFFPEQPSDWRGQISSLYRSLNPDVCRLVKSGEARQYGYYLPLDRLEAFAAFVTNTDHHDHAARRGQAIGASMQLKKARLQIAQLQTDKAALAARVERLEAVIAAIRERSAARAVSVPMKRRVRVKARSIAA